jgi:uncharacterized protein (TIGR00369 family)
VTVEYDESYEDCYVCGKENLEGLRLDFHYDAEQDEMFTRCTFRLYMQGYKGLVHGGFLSMLLDEVMAKACIHRGTIAVTVQFDVRFRKPVYVQEELLFYGKVTEKKGKKIRTESRCVDSENRVRATASAVFLQV